MQLRPEQLSAHLEKPLAPLYVLHGDDPLLTIEAGDALRAAARRQGFDERNVLVVTPTFRWDELFHAAGNLSLFGGRTLVDLRMPTGKPGRDGGEALARYCKALPADVLTLITLPEMDWRAKKAAWFTTLINAGIAIECRAPALTQLPNWIANRLKTQQQSAPPEALEFIALHVEGNLLAAHQEIQKLGLLHPPGALTLAQVSAAVLNVARYDIDDLRTALQAKDTARCARTLEGLRAEDAPLPLVLWALTMEARTRALRPALLHAARIDRIIKGLASGDRWDECLQLSLRLTRA
ncbi:MAG: DNA polymerase III subunit delta [Gammaproteobacteria bacterium]|nr:DNA polymerase III subunit delta [Rhodocyclaceae bacterium]MBU3909362.1 DNA polymerase III subunit delta [Gammaproteobacteria bacterium]MBU3990183.1 DNA polymerase III subunit delta [Gammaproteobacteria bacterium]MBU4005478.1 DNA polymerase III subunit delta [Gammaproteobacteria bacterium]MBU4020969.1 DNA polymerase III subunit delta [Gammaproteobacteria bacterium]